MQQEIASLYDAAGQGDLRAVKTFLKRGVAVDDVPNEYCRTPLAHAAERGHIAVVKLLISRGASIDGERYGTPLSWAVEGKQSQMALYLLARGAKCPDCRLVAKAIDANLPEVAEVMIRRGALADANQVGSILQQAASKGLGAVVDCVLANGAVVNWKNRGGETVLHLAAKAGRLDIVRKLLHAGADVYVVDVHGKTALHLAAEAGRHEVARALLDGGAEVSAQDFMGFTPLHMAVRKGRVSTTETLMQCGASPDIPDSFGNTGLQWAQDSTELLEVLSRPGMPHIQAAKAFTEPEPLTDPEQNRARAISCIARRVSEIVAEQMGVDMDQILPSTNFVNDLNCDSLDTVELVMEFEDEFGIQIPDEEAEKLCTAGDVVDFMLERLMPHSQQWARSVLSS